MAQTSLMAIQGPQYPITALFMFFAGGTASGFLFLVRAMLADYSDELRLNQGVTRSGLLFSFIGVTQKLAGSFNTAISFGILAWVGFDPDEHAHNTFQRHLRPRHDLCVRAHRVRGGHGPVLLWLQARRFGLSTPRSAKRWMPAMRPSSTKPSPMS